MLPMRLLRIYWIALKLVLANYVTAVYLDTRSIPLFATVERLMKINIKRKHCIRKTHNFSHGRLTPIIGSMQKASEFAKKKKPTK